MCRLYGLTARNMQCMLMLTYTLHPKYNIHNGLTHSKHTCVAKCDNHTVLVYHCILHERILYGIRSETYIFHTHRMWNQPPTTDVTLLHVCVSHTNKFSSNLNYHKASCFMEIFIVCICVCIWMGEGLHVNASKNLNTNVSMACGVGRAQGRVICISVGWVISTTDGFVLWFNPDIKLDRIMKLKWIALITSLYPRSLPVWWSCGVDDGEELSKLYNFEAINMQIFES